MRLSEVKLFKLHETLEFPWYNSQNKATRKYKLGVLYYATVKSHEKSKDKQCVCRSVELERISSYVIESFQNRMLQLI